MCEFSMKEMQMPQSLLSFGMTKLVGATGIVGWVASHPSNNPISPAETCHSERIHPSDDGRRSEESKINPKSHIRNPK
jgi:hypothetical protein